MLTEIPVDGSGPAATDATGPVTSDVALDGTDLTATVDDTARGGSTVAEAEYYLDDLTRLRWRWSAADAAFDATTEDVTVAVSIGSGDHVLYVRGRDAAGNWGPFSSVLVTGADSGGPTTLSPLLTPRVTNGTGTVAVSATGDDSASGNSHIQARSTSSTRSAATATGTPMTVNQDAPIASLDGTIAAGLGEGPHVVWIHAQDAQSNWGDAISVTLVVDKTGPATSGTQVQPTPNNGTRPVQLDGPGGARLGADDVRPGLRQREQHDRQGRDVHRHRRCERHRHPADRERRVVQRPSEGGYADIPLGTVKALANGTHTLYVHARDEAGNWGTGPRSTHDPAGRQDGSRPERRRHRAEPHPGHPADPHRHRHRRLDRTGRGRVVHRHRPRCGQRQRRDRSVQQRDRSLRLRRDARPEQPQRGRLHPAGAGPRRCRQLECAHERRGHRDRAALLLHARQHQPARRDGNGRRLGHLQLVGHRPQPGLGRHRGSRPGAGERERGRLRPGRRHPLLPVVLRHHDDPARGRERPGRGRRLLRQRHVVGVLRRNRAAGSRTRRTTSTRSAWSAATSTSPRPATPTRQE